MSKIRKDNDTDLDLFGNIPAPGAYDPFAGIDPALLGNKSSESVSMMDAHHAPNDPKNLNQNTAKKDETQDDLQEKNQPQKTSAQKRSTVTISSRQVYDPAFHLQDNYAAVLDYLLSLSPRITRLSEISEATGIPFGTVRKAIDRLVSDGFITKPKRYTQGRIKGFSFEINKARCKRFINIRREDEILKINAQQNSQ